MSAARNTLSRATQLKQDGNALNEKERFEEGLQKYKEAFTLLKDVDESTITSEEKDELSKLRVILLSNSSHICLWIGKYQQAKDFAEDALDIDPEHEKSRRRRAEAENKMNEELWAKGPKHSTTNVLNDQQPTGTCPGVTHMGHNVYQAAGPASEADVMRALTEGVQLNNEGVQLSHQMRHAEALDRFNRALRIKERAYGIRSKHCLITMSGIADALLGLRRVEEAEEEANRMLEIAQNLGERDQERIAREILGDISREKARMKKK